MLTGEQTEFFARNGFLQIKGAIASADCDYLADKSWECLPQHWQRDDPATWTGPVTDSCHTADLSYRRGHLKYQKLPIRKERRALGIFGTDSPIGALAKNLLGATPIVRCRGLYMLVPFPEVTKLPRLTAPHVEAHAVQIVATTYLRDVPAGAGGLLVWPGSHWDLYPQFESKLEFKARNGYNNQFRRYKSLRPVELAGHAGDVILIHHRLFHAPSLNFGNQIRFALFSDYLHPDYAARCAEQPGFNPFEDWALECVSERSPYPQFALQPAEQSDYAGEIPSIEHHTTYKKREASRLVRSIHDGDIWLMLSSSDKLAGRTTIEPCGGELPDLRVLVDGRSVASLTKDDFIVRLTEEPTEIIVYGAPPELSVRVVRIRSPVARSDLLIDELVRQQPNIAISISESSIRSISSSTWPRLKPSKSLFGKHALGAILRRLRVGPYQ